MVKPQVVGRLDELRTLRSELAAAADDGPRVVTVIGEAGIGKTSLLAEFVDEIAGQDLTVLRASPTVTEQQVPWGTLRLLVAHCPVEELPPPVRSAIGQETAADAARVGASATADDVAFGFARYVARLANERPVVVVLDNLQWVDSSSAAAASFAMRSAGDALWVLAQREDTVPDIDAQQILPDERCATVRLAGLRPADLATLVESVTGRTAGLVGIDRLHELTGGNPLYAREIARAYPLDHEWERLRLPPSLTALFSARLSALPAVAFDVMSVAALSPRPTIDLICRVCTDFADREDAERALGIAEQSGLLHVIDDGISFDHALVRQAVLDRLGGIDRAALHRRLAQATDEIEMRAWHLGEGSTERSEEVAAQLEEAGLAMHHRGASARAGQLLERAAALTPDAASPQRFRRMASAGDAATDAGLWSHAAELLAEAIPHVDGEILTAAVSASIVCADRLGGIDATEDVALHGLGFITDPLARSTVLRTLVRVHQFFDLRLAQTTAEQAVTEAIRSGDFVQTLSAHAALANNSFLIGAPIDLDRLVADVALADAPPNGQSAEWYVAELLVWNGRDDEARTFLERSAEYARRTGNMSCASHSLEQLGDLAFRSGDWATADKMLDEIDDLVGAYGTHAALHIMPERIVWAAAQGRREEARARCIAADEALSSMVGVHRFSLCTACGFAALAEQKWDEACAYLDQATVIAEALGLVSCLPDEFRSDHVEALVRVGRLDDAEAVVDVVEAYAARIGSDVASVQATFARGLTLTGRGAYREAIERLTIAATAVEMFDRPFIQGRVLLALGVAERKAGMRAKARESLTRARTVFERLGATPWTERVTAEMARLGTRSATASTTALTATEHQVAVLARQGRSNREIAAEMIVSLRTVESNLTRVYRKLDVRSRTELAALAASRIA